MPRFDDTQTIEQKDIVEVETANIDREEIEEILERDLGRVPRNADFWCISLTLLEYGVKMVINMSTDVVLGRAIVDSGNSTAIDLSGYSARELGVSRHHATIASSGSRVIVKDNNSTNTTLLNGKKLRPMQEYPLKPGDKITLGKLELQFDLLYNPFSG